MKAVRRASALRRLLALAVLGVPVTALAVVPKESAIGKAGPQTQRLLLSSFEADSRVQKGGWQITSLTVTPAPAGVEAKAGAVALQFAGKANVPGAKGDFAVASDVPGQCRALGLWVHLAADANVGTVGLQVHDAEGEVLLATVPADWQGWRWVEFDLAGSALRQAYEQKAKNGKVDQGVKGVHVIWFARQAGQSSITVDGLVGATDLPAGGVPRVWADLSGGSSGEPGQRLGTQIVLTNTTDQPAAATVEFSVQQDAALTTIEAPDPVHGTNHALGAKSWTEVDGKRIEEGSLTDGFDWTHASTTWRSNFYAEATQVVDLGRERRITHLAARSGDANWTWKVNVEASADGTTFTPIAALQNVDLHQKWGLHAIPVAEPFAARFLRLRYHNGGVKSSVIRMPAELAVYDGVADETYEVPAVGKAVAKGSVTLEAPARSFAVAPIGDATPLAPGSYFVAVKVRTGQRTDVSYRRALVLPPRMERVSPESRFGMNASEPSLAPMLRRLGVGWVRFENMKWPMASAGPGQFRFDGGVAPWHVNHDAIFEAYTREGMSVLPFLFLTAEHASSAAAPIPKGRWGSYPPRDYGTFAEFCFQTVARYGTAAHPEAALKTNDHKSALGRISTFEIWNEPNLNAPGWGPWVAPIEQYFDLFRPAAEAVKRADPKALVTNGGYAGIKVETVDKLQSYRYPDGKRPLDFVDVLNVHYYSGRQAPETATIDTNVHRDVLGKGPGITYEDDLRSLVKWRDQYKPGLPIWLTETGYDSAGPFGTDERIQAARMPRVIMLALANGMDKVFLYREKGSAASQHAASGIIREDESVKPSWLTYATLIRALDGATRATRLAHTDANVRVYLWEGPAGKPVLTAWAIDDVPATLGLDLGACTITDAFGHHGKAAVAKDQRVTIFPTYITDIAGVNALRALAEKPKP